MERRSDWDRRLQEWLAAMEGVRFEWGAADCCTFAAGAVEAMTGIDPMAEFRGRYATEAGAARALRRYGAGTLEATLDAKFPERPIGFARRGDLATNEGGAVGVVLGGEAAFVGCEEGMLDGLVRLPRAAWRKCWGVGA